MGSYSLMGQTPEGRPMRGKRIRERRLGLEEGVAQPATSSPQPPAPLGPRVGAWGPAAGPLPPTWRRGKTWPPPPI